MLEYEIDYDSWGDEPIIGTERRLHDLTFRDRDLVYEFAGDGGDRLG